MSRDSAVVIGGDQITKITARQKLLDPFLRLTHNANVVIACRVSPK
jgi:phospholipid-transporting ATPase